MAATKGFYRTHADYLRATIKAREAELSEQLNPKYRAHVEIVLERSLSALRSELEFGPELRKIEAEEGSYL